MSPDDELVIEVVERPLRLQAHTYHVTCDVCGRGVVVTLGLVGSNHTAAVWARCVECVKVPEGEVDA